MTRITGYYLLIQYCPDPSRLEAANVGVVLFCPEPFYLKARTAKGNGRIRQFFRPVDPDWGQINIIKYSIEGRLTVDRDRFRDLASLERFAATRANAMRLTSPRALAMEDPDAELDRLFDKLVGDSASNGAARTRKFLGRTFRKEGLGLSIRRNVTVSLPGFEQSVRVPYGFQNERFNLIKPASFQDLGMNGILRKAGKYAIEGELLHRHSDPRLGEMRLIIVGHFTDEQREIAATLGEVLQANHTDLYTTEDIPRLVTVIKTTSRPIADESPR